MSMNESGTRAPEPDTVVFITAEPLEAGEVVLHKAPTARVTRRLEEVKNDWDAIVKQITTIIAGTAADVQESGFEFKDLSVGLGFSASGKLGFIAQAGVEASITVTFAKQGSK